VLWRAVAISGIGLLAIGLGAFGVDFLTMGHFDFIAAHSLLFLIAIGIGVVSLFVGLIGWAKQLRRQRRAMMGGFLFVAPVAICLLASLIGGTNVHGPFYLFLLPMSPVSLLGLALLLMSAAPPRS
jgi:hypothetical protein